MNFNPVYLSFLTVIMVSSCTSEPKVSGSSSIDKISKLTCEATYLRKARFALADSIRYFQDSVLQADHASNDKIRRWETELKNMSNRKNSLAIQSRNLADSIRTELLELTKEMTLEEKRKFNENLQKTDCNNR